MKAAAFEYVRAGSLDEACRLLAGSGERKIIAGGQTLVPLMAMRLARPDMLVDINDLHELRGIRDRGDAVAVGALARQRDVERSDMVAQKLPLLAEAIRHVGHQQTRNRGLPISHKFCLDADAGASRRRPPGSATRRPAP